MSYIPNVFIISCVMTNVQLIIFRPAYCQKKTYTYIHLPNQRGSLHTPLRANSGVGLPSHTYQPTGDNACLYCNKLNRCLILVKYLQMPPSNTSFVTQILLKLLAQRYLPYGCTTSSFTGNQMVTRSLTQKTLQYICSSFQTINDLYLHLPHIRGGVRQ